MIPVGVFFVELRESYSIQEQQGTHGEIVKGERFLRHALPLQALYYDAATVS